MYNLLVAYNQGAHNNSSKGEYVMVYTCAKQTGDLTP